MTDRHPSATEFALRSARWERVRAAWFRGCGRIGRPEEHLSWAEFHERTAQQLQAALGRLRGDLEPPAQVLQEAAAVVSSTAV